MICEGLGAQRWLSVGSWFCHDPFTELFEAFFTGGGDAILEVRK